jgi:hypothetical protein
VSKITVTIKEKPDEVVEELKKNIYRSIYSEADVDFVTRVLPKLEAEYPTIIIDSITTTMRIIEEEEEKKRKNKRRNKNGNKSRIPKVR